MTTTTTLRIEEDLKDRIAHAAQEQGVTAHAFMLDALARTVERLELAGEFERLAEERWQKLLVDGKTVAWDEARAYALARAKGEPAKRPTARKLTRR